MGLGTLLRWIFSPCAGSQALDCRSGSLDTIKNVSDLHLVWTTGWNTCEIGEGCYETVILIQNGQELNLVVTKGCTTAINKEPQITRHRTGPGISIISYTHVCRHEDFCNDLSSTETIWIPPPVTAPGTLRCPHCLSTHGCDNVPEVCPAGTHCYSGILKLRGVGLSSNLRIQGCMSQSGCNVLNGTQTIGRIDVSENCNPGSGPQALECKSGKLEVVIKLSKLPLHWTTSWQTCKIGEGCQETMVLIQNGPEVNFVMTKGCTRDRDQKPRLTQHRTGPGLSITSYTHVCRSRDFCNDLSSTDVLWIPPPVTGTGTLSCPLCLSKDDCPKNPPEQVCPTGSTDCYNGLVELRGGGIFTDLRVQGCMPQPGCNLLNGTQTIGPIDVNENCSPQLVSKALKCQHGTLVTIREISELPLQWTAGQVTCEVGEGCQDTLMMVETGQQVSLVLTKGCTSIQDHKARVTEHRTGPGLSVISYTRVCRQEDLCNYLSTTAPLWAPPPASAPGTLRCPRCLSTKGCDEASEQVCPAGSTACYSGVLRVMGGEIITSLRVGGCMPQPGCNLLNGTRKIGPMDVSENCNPQLDTLTCHRGVMLKFSSSLAEEAVAWTSPGTQECEAGEVCQETLLLVDVGQKAILVGSKGCSKAGAQNAMGVSIYSRPPGVVIASYAQFCSSDLCNRASSSSVLLGSLPRPAAPRPGDLRCPVCVQFSGSCSRNTNFVTCPQGTTHCYNGNIELRGGGLSSTMSIQGCMTSSSKSLLGNSKMIGIFSAKEIHEGKKDTDTQLPNGVTSVSNLAWVLALGLSLALFCGGLCPPC
uniref:CD177 antigen n=1 Tax=Nannospalax galili TaxID=1026970 RepID=A0A8C6QTR2_NANGA